MVLLEVSIFKVFMVRALRWRNLVDLLVGNRLKLCLTTRGQFPAFPVFSKTVVNVFQKNAIYLIGRKLSDFQSDLSSRRAAKVDYYQVVAKPNIIFP